MADPVVHITNGIPDAGTGTITTLGQTLLDGANIALGATTDLTVAAGAAGTINSHLRTISRDIASGIVLQSGANTIGAVNQAGAPWSISGTVGISGTVTVSGTVAATQSGTWNINNISGTISLPTGAATAAKQPALGTAGTPSTDVITVQGATSMVALKVDGSAVTQPISGNVGITGNVNCVQVTSPWVTSVSGNVSVVQGGNLTTRIVGNSGNTVDFASTQNATTPQAALLVGAEFNTVPTTITSGNSSPLQMDSSANLLVNVKTGTVAATQSGTWNMRLQDGSGNAITSTSSAIDVNIKSGGGSGGTSSNFGSAFPASGTAAGANVVSSAPTYTAGNMNGLTMDTSGNLRVNVVAGGAGGGAVFGPTAVGSAAANPPVLIAGTANATATGTVQVAKVSSSGLVSVDASGATVPVSGTFWQATQPVSGTVTVTQATAANLNATVTGTVAATQSGTWNITNISGTISLPTGAATSANQPTAAALGSTTSGQTGNLAFGAVTSAAPTYTTATSNALSLTTAGALRVDGSAVTQPVSGTFWQTTQPVSGTVTANQGGAPWTVKPDGTAWAMTSTSANVNVTNASIAVTGTFWQATQPVSGTITANQGGTWTVQPGNTANTTPWLVTPKGFQDSGGTDITDTTNHALKVNIVAGAGSGGTASTVGSANPSQATAAGYSDGTNMQLARVFDGDTGAGTQYSLGVLLKTPASGGAVDFGVASQPIRVDPVGTTTQPVSIAAHVVVDQGTAGSAWPVSLTSTTITGTVAVTQSTSPWIVAGGGTAGSPGTAVMTVQGIGGGTAVPVSGTFWQTTQPVSIAATVAVNGAAVTNADGVATNTASVPSASYGYGFNGTTWDRLQVDGTKNLKVTVATALPTGANTIGAVTQASGPWTNNVTQFGGTNISTGTGAGGAGIPRVTISNDSTVNPQTIGTWGLAASTQNVTTPTNGMLVQGEFNTTPTTITSGNSSPLQLDSAGNLLVNIKAGGGAGGTSSTIGAALPGTATVAMGSVTTAAPTYTTATANALSLDTSGNLRVATPATTATGPVWNNATSLNTTYTIANNPSVLGQVTVTTTITAGALTFEESYDLGATWSSVPAGRLVNPTTGVQIANPYTLVANTNLPFQIISSGTTQMRIRLSTAITGTGSASIFLTSSPLLNEVQVYQNNASNLLVTASQGGAPWSVHGNTAWNTADAGNPIKIGGYGTTTNPGAVTSGNRVNAIFDKLGKQITVGAIRELKGVQKTSISNTTETTVVTAGGAGVFNDVYAIIVTNKSATAAFVDFKDSTGGTTRMTVAAPAGDTRGITLEVGSAIPQASANANWTATASAAVSSLEITMLYVANL